MRKSAWRGRSLQIRGGENWESQDPTQLPGSERVAPRNLQYDLDLASVSKLGLGSSGYADTTGSRLMRGMDPMNYQYGDIANNAAQAADRGVSELLKITRMEQADTETQILEMEREGSVIYHELGKDQQDSGIAHLGVRGSNPADIQEALQISTGPVYEYGHSLPNPAKVAVLVSERVGGLTPEYLTALAQVEHDQGIMDSLPIRYEADRRNYNGTGGMILDEQMQENGGVPLELIDLAMREDAAREMSAPNPAAKTHPGASNYMDPTGQLQMSGQTGQELALVQASPEAADYLVGSGDGVVQYPDDTPRATAQALLNGALGGTFRGSLFDKLLTEGEKLAEEKAGAIVTTSGTAQAPQKYSRMTSIQASQASQAAQASQDIRHTQTGKVVLGAAAVLGVVGLFFLFKR